MENVWSSCQPCFSGYRCHRYAFARLTVFVESSARNPFGIEGYSSSTYGDSFADVYDDWYQNLNDTDFVQSIVRDLPTSPVRVLELGVGTGRLVRQFLTHRASAADSYVGVDSSEAMLTVARAQRFPAHVHIERADFSEFIPRGPFDAIFVGYNTLFNLPNELAVQRCFTLVCEQLAPSGHFYVDVVRPVDSDNADHRTIRHMNTDEVVLSESTHDAQQQRITGRFIQFSRNQNVRIRPYSVRYFSPEQLDAMAEKAGLHLVKRSEDGNGTMFTLDSPRHVSKYAQTSPSPSILKAP